MKMVCHWTMEDGKRHFIPVCNGAVNSGRKRDCTCKAEDKRQWLRKHEIDPLGADYAHMCARLQQVEEDNARLRAVNREQRAKIKELRDALEEDTRGNES